MVVGAAEVVEVVVVPRLAGTPGRGRSSGRSGPGSRWPKPGAQGVGGWVEAGVSGRVCACACVGVGVVVDVEREVGVWAGGCWRGVGYVTLACLQNLRALMYAMLKLP